jgi:hypothetical protein
MPRIFYGGVAGPGVDFGARRGRIRFVDEHNLQNTSQGHRFSLKFD